MKKQYIFLPLILGLLWVSMQSKVAGPAAGGVGDCTTTGCGGSGCHTGTFTPSIFSGVTLMDASGTTTVSSYTPGASYRILVGAALATLPKFGFQVKAVNSSGASVGTMVAPASTHTTAIGAVTVCEHSMALNAVSGVDSISIPWTAPAAGTGTVDLKAAINSVDGTGTAAGDQYKVLSSSVTENTSSIGGPSTVCVGNSITLTHATSGGTWSSGSTSIATIGASTGILTGVAAGTVIITYNTGTANETTTVTVNAKPTAVITSSKDSVCVSKTAAFTATPSGGGWVSRYTSIATIGATSGIATGVSAGIDTIVYYAFNLCGVDSAKKGLKVNPLTAACTAGLPEPGTLGEELLVFPNPNYGTFTLDVASPLNGQAYVVVTNAAGAKVKEFTLNTNRKHELQLNQPAGVYFITATTLTNRYHVKVVVQ